MKNKSLDFVARYYRHGALDVKSAYRKTLEKAIPGLLRPSPWKKVGVKLAVAAAIAVLLIGGGILLFRPSVTTLASADANRIVTLGDGTVVTLAPHSALSYRGNCREVELSGKAYLNIRHDPERPFTVKDADYVIKDIGTRLLVDETSEGVTTVYVEEGCVALSSPRRQSGGIVLRKGEGASVTGSGELKRMAKASQNVTAWAIHEFHFDDTPLHEVLRDLSACYNVSLICPAADGKRLTADFHADSLRNIVDMIEETLGVEINTK